MAPRMFVLFALLAATKPPSAAPTPKPDSLLVLDLQAVAVPKDVATALTAQVAEQVAARTNVHVVTLADLDDAARQQKSLESLGCQDASCMADISRLANSPRVVTGSVGKVGSEYIVTLTLIDAKAARVLGKADAHLPNLQSAAAPLGHLVAQLFGLPDTAPQRTSFKLSGKETSFAVFDLKPLGIPDDTARNLTQVLAAEIKRVQGTRVVSRDDIASMLALESQKDQLGCTDSITCLAEIGGALGVDKLIVGSVGKIEASFVVSLRMIDARKTVVDNRVTESFQGLTEQLVPAVRSTGRRLIGLDAPQPGGLTVSTSEQRAQIFVNDKEVGESPLAPLQDLPAGKHNLRLKKSGYADWRSDIFIEPGDMTAVWAPIVALPLPWYKTWWFWTIVGGVAAGAAVTTVVLVVGDANGTLRVEYTRGGR